MFWDLIIYVIIWVLSKTLTLTLNTRIRVSVRQLSSAWRFALARSEVCRESRSCREFCDENSGSSPARKEGIISLRKFFILGKGFSDEF